MKQTDEDAAQTEILKTSQTVAIVGLSDKEDRPSYEVAAFLQTHGYKIIPVNPNIEEVLGEKAYPNLLSIPKEIKIDVVDIFRKPHQVIPHIKDALERGGIKTIWLAEGVGSPEAESFALSNNFNLVSNFCMMKSYKKLKLQDNSQTYKP